MAKLICGNFSLEILFVTHVGDVIDDKEKDTNENVYDIYIGVKDSHYSGDMTMNYFTQSYINQSLEKLLRLYESLEDGKAGFYELYEHQFVEFISDGLGHFTIKGSLIKNYNSSGNEWSLKFTQHVDQTYLKNFIQQLKAELN